MNRGLMILRHAAAAVSLLLWALATGLWFGSYASQYEIQRGPADGFHAILVSRGELRIDLVRNGPYFILLPTVAVEWHGEKSPSSDLLQAVTLEFAGTRSPVAGFFFGRRPWFGGDVTVILLPMPLVVCVLALFPILDLTAAGYSFTSRRQRSTPNSMVRSRLN
jgi:hypothetical protein